MNPKGLSPKKEKEKCLPPWEGSKTKEVFPFPPFGLRSLQTMRNLTVAF